MNTPLVFESPFEMRNFSLSVKSTGKRIGFVPTMGALHAGHLSLMDHARQLADCLVVSIFVNPLQFDQDADLNKYPRTWERDLDLCAAHGADAVFAPNPGNMYPEGYQTKVAVGPMTQGLCGACRPGHFEGVTTVVLKLFNTVLPDVAIFGEKDYQQLRVIQRMVKDLDLGVEVIGRPTVREEDGLAMSSRNKHLSSKQRENALCLFRALNHARQLAAGGERKALALIREAAKMVEKTPEARLEYLQVVGSQDLQPLEELNKPARMCLAVWMGETRLIDNLELG